MKSAAEERVKLAADNITKNAEFATLNLLFAIEIRLGEIARELVRFNMEKNAFPPAHEPPDET